MSLLAKPKSVILIWPVLSINIFSGFRSLYMCVGGGKGGGGGGGGVRGAFHSNRAAHTHKH